MSDFLSYYEREENKLITFFGKYSNSTTMPKTSISKFQSLVYSYYKEHRRPLPWRTSASPYRVIVSEIMLQQTQVDRVAIKYKEFIKTFPDFNALAKAPLQKVLETWQGMGYNRRALFLKKCSEAIINKYNGRFPKDIEAIKSLPGIGPATAASISAFAFNTPTVFIETNIRSVYLHFFFNNKKAVRDALLLPLIEKTLDKDNPRKWYNALMDFGTFIKKHHPNPSRRSAHHSIQSKFSGSNRELRGKLLRLITNKKRTLKECEEHIPRKTKEIKYVLTQLQNDGFIREKMGVYTIS